MTTPSFGRNVKLSPRLGLGTISSKPDPKKNHPPFLYKRTTVDEQDFQVYDAFIDNWQWLTLAPPY